MYLDDFTFNFELKLRSVKSSYFTLTALSVFILKYENREYFCLNPLTQRQEDEFDIIYTLFFFHYLYTLYMHMHK